MTTNTQSQAQRDARGRMLAPLPGAAPAITSDTAREMVKKRQEKYRRAAVSRIVKEAQSIDPTVSNSADAYGLVLAKQYTVLMDSEKPVIGQVEKLGDLLTGAAREEPQRTYEPPTGEISASPSTLLELVGLIEAHKAQAVDRARAVDGDTIRDAE